MVKDRSNIFAPACRGQNSKKSCGGHLSSISNNKGAMTPRNLTCMEFEFFRKNYCCCNYYSPNCAWLALAHDLLTLMGRMR